MNSLFDTVTIIGVGLLGGSLGQALKARGLAKTIRGVGRRQSSLDKAIEVGAIDAAFLNMRDAAAGAGLVVICTPAGHTTQALDQLRSLCGPDTIVTDVASTKARICEHARKTWPMPSHFVGSHPMAGSEKFGPEHATPRLFEDCVTVLEAGDHIDAEARRAVRELWLGVGARVVEMDPILHDAIAARTSHVPHLMAACIAAMGAIDLDTYSAEIRALIGKGFRDVTRIAASRAETWRDICLTNRDAVLAGLDEVLAALTQVREAVAAGDASAVEAFFDKGKIARDALVHDPENIPDEGTLP